MAMLFLKTPRSKWAKHNSCGYQSTDFAIREEWPFIKVCKTMKKRKDLYEVGKKNIPGQVAEWIERPLLILYVRGSSPGPSINMASLPRSLKAPWGDGRTAGSLYWVKKAESRKKNKLEIWGALLCDGSSLPCLAWSGGCEIPLTNGDILTLSGVAFLAVPVLALSWLAWMALTRLTSWAEMVLIRGLRRRISWLPGATA